ncbi:hypothetical protein ACFL5G_02505 [Candidatus Margulisiibacteriota bacterium]
MPLLKTLKEKLRPLKNVLAPSDMKKVFIGLKKRGVVLNSLNVLEVFAYTGENHAQDYFKLVNSLEAWEINAVHKAALEKNLPGAKIKIVDSYAEIKSTPNKFNIIIIDNEMGFFGDNHCEHFEIFPDIFRCLDNSGLIIVNVLTKKDKLAQEKFSRLFDTAHNKERAEFYQTNTPDNVSFKKMLETYQTIIDKNNYQLEWCFFQKRLSFLHYLVLKVKKKS